MNPVVLQFANGNSFFIGLAMVVVSLFLRLWTKGRTSGIALRVCFIAGMAFVIFSATPMSIFIYFAWFAICVVGARIAFGEKFSRAKKIQIAAVIFICSLAIALLELPFHFASKIKVARNQTVSVIGDSISAGLSRHEEPWPEVLGDVSHLKVVNLAKAAASIESAMDQAGLVSSNSIVLVEIGGNDFLGHTDGKTFYNQLDALLNKLHAGNNQIVMFELPLFPFCNNFGKAQRVLAKKYNAILVPKHYLTDVFALKDGTLDGLHLSQKGHDALANSIFNLMQIN